MNYTKPFTERVYEVVKKIPVGKVATYQDIARLAGNPKASRAVGTAMKHNPDMKAIPCHRVVGSDGKMHGYTFGEGETTKIQRLKEEGIPFLSTEKIDLATCRWNI